MDTFKFFGTFTLDALEEALLYTFADEVLILAGMDANAEGMMPAVMRIVTSRMETVRLVTRENIFSTSCLLYYRKSISIILQKYFKNKRRLQLFIQ